ncbi:MAG: ceramidase domain-containing protein [Bdellovibrionales bacterium]|nr:ceramidase domain-containing protein [Bdellovibrionales bacterium]
MLQSPECPWGSFAPSEVDFCEANVCGWVVEPANSISCIGYVIVGILLMRAARKERLHGFLTLMGPIAIAIGVFSVALHATLTRWGSFLDLSSMYLMAWLFLLLNYRRLREEKRAPVGARTLTAVYVAGNIGAALAQLLWAKAGIPIFGLLIIITGLSEIALWRGQKRRVDYRWFWGTALSFGLSLFVWALDLTRVVCVPDNHVFTGHSFWHFGNAVSIYAYYRFYRQFEPGASSR